MRATGFRPFFLAVGGLDRSNSMLGRMWLSLVRFCRLPNVSRIVPISTVALWCLVVGAYLFLLYLVMRQKRNMSAIDELLKGSDGSRLEPLLVEHMRSKAALQSNCDELRKRVDDLEREALRQVGNIGIIRYNAFEEVGGDQSFVLALINEVGDGVVVNSITARSQTKVYAKVLRKGVCEQPLSPEEAQALNKAKSRRQTAVDA